MKSLFDLAFEKASRMPGSLKSLPRELRYRVNLERFNLLRPKNQASIIAKRLHHKFINLQIDFSLKLQSGILSSQKFQQLFPYDPITYHNHIINGGEDYDAFLNLGFVYDHSRYMKRRTDRLVICEIYIIDTVSRIEDRIYLYLEKQSIRRLQCLLIPWVTSFFKPGDLDYQIPEDWGEKEQYNDRFNTRIWRKI